MTNRGYGYETAESWQDALDTLKRKRKEVWFILSRAGVDKEKPHCGACGNLISEAPVPNKNVNNGETINSDKYSNRCIYYPARRKAGKPCISIVHYTCGWTRTLNAILGG